MNKPNNKRRQETRRRIENVFVELMQSKEIIQVSVTEICQKAEVNRTTFYANYLDVYDLAEAVKKRLEEEVFSLYQQEWESGSSSHNFLKLFYHIRENPMVYKTYFKLNREGSFRFIGYSMEDAVKRFGNRNMEYHIAFFGNGLNAMLKKWLENGCRETPEEINEILREEYRGIPW